METTEKFRKDTKIDWYRCKVDKEVLRELMQTSDAKALRHVSCQLGLFCATGALAYAAFRQVNASTWMWSVPLLYLALFVHGTNGPFMGYVAVHELCHKTPFRSKRWNEFFLNLYSFVSWSDPVWFRPSHVKHHQVTVHRDYDGEVVLPAKMNFKDWKFWTNVVAWNPQFTWTVLKSHWQRARGKVDGDWNKFILPESNAILRKQYRDWARLVLIGHAVLATIFVLTGHWFLIVVFTFGTQYCGWLGYLCAMPQHYGMAWNVTDHRLCCRTYTCSWLPAFYYWNMQYHIEHHMYPAVPFYNLPKLRQALLHDLPPAPHGLIATWKEMLAIHKQQKTDANFIFAPKLPSSAGEHAGDDVLEREASHAGAG